MALVGTSYHHNAKDLRLGLMRSLEAPKVPKVPKVHIQYLYSPDRTVLFEETLCEVNKLYQEGYFEKLGINRVKCPREMVGPNPAFVKEYTMSSTELSNQSCCHAFDTMVSHSTVSNPLAAGMLTNCYSRDKPDATAGGRFDPNAGPGAPTRRRYYQEADFDVLDILGPVAQKHGLTDIECALRWLSHHS
ncbi:hypothetical protein N7449_006868 [Penicillium cf. viridicatum]|uniref:NADP-dependent oxidoreductase domain-containing protein n=1 Tax=Penicillium cf. viridicatum TaxID=2972119 RepID=A0A9W9MC52_9EURO|nr:hypothetical protein N7449_006868 [Penicillium cf. viridicatum]